MGIQVTNSLHAAGTYFVQGTALDMVVSQSTNGMLISRFFDEPTGITFFQILLDYPLDPGSCSYACHVFLSLDPETALEAAQPFVPLLIHVTDKEKLLFLVTDLLEPADAADATFHLQFTNFQANLREMLPVNDFTLPAVP